MGLDTTHGCWHGAYSAFMRWRTKLAEVAGIPLLLMEGFYEPPEQSVMERTAPSTCADPYGALLHGWVTRNTVGLSIRWDTLRPDPLHWLLNHSDCDGDIPPEQCGPLANRLEELLPLLPEGDGGGHIGIWREKTRAFIDGLRCAEAAGEAVEFH